MLPPTPPPAAPAAPAALRDMQPLAYLEQFQVQQTLTLAIKSVLRTRPDEPVQAIADYLLEKSGASSAAGEFTVLSWNLAAINNNPFEYWLTHPDAEYASLMESVESFISAPGDKDVPVSEVFTPVMYASLEELMTAQGWDGAEACAAAWAELAQRPIISGFLKDKGLGDKRLMSMPDRMSNTIDVVGGGLAYRPTVISSFDGDMATVDKWWSLWTKFFFSDKIEVPGKKGAPAASKLPCELLSKIPRAKYPALSEEEEAMSLRLQTLCLAIFDAILLHILVTLSTDGKWLVLKRQILEALTWSKEKKQVDMLQTAYAGTDVIFLQEVRTAAMTATYAEAFGAAYSIACPATPSKADQNSIVLLAKSKYDAASITDLTAEVMAQIPADAKAKASDGDIVVVSAVEIASGKTIVFASFHGDTDGLATASTLAAVSAVCEKVAPAALIFGLDANTYISPKPGKQAGAADFVSDCASKGLSHVFGDAPLAECLTTSNARTFLQPQLQKACKASDKKTLGDFNPKDYILFTSSAYALSAAGKDNTGERKYVEDMVVPTLTWPSDHGLVYATLKPK